MTERDTLLAAMARENRIEALRAASRVVAGMCASSDGMLALAVAEKKDGRTTTEETVLYIADQFARWLEEG